MSVDIPEITPQKLSDDVEVVLVVTAPDRAGHAWAYAYTDSSMGSAEASARQMLSGDSCSRFAGLVRVRVPRALLRERWTEAQS